VVINHVKTAAAAKNAYARLKGTVHKFLPVKISPLGIVAQDRNVPISVVSQIPFFMLFPDTDASRCIRSIAMKLLKDPLGKADMPMELFWDKCLAFLSPKKPVAIAHTSGTGQQSKVAGQTRDKEPAMVSDRDNQADLKDRMSAIEDKISLLLNGMEEIKALLKGNDFETAETVEPDAKESLSQKPAPPSPGLIPLDFESWVKEQSGKL